MTTPHASADLDRLAELLMTEASPDTAMDLSTLDGFIAAALAGPEGIELAEVLPLMLGQEEPGQELSFASEAEADELVALIAQHWRDTAHTLANHPEDYQPIVYAQTLASEDDESDDEDEELSVIDDWCCGFIRGLQVQDDLFGQLTDELKDLLGPVFLYGTVEGAEELERMQLSNEQHESIAEARPAIVTAVYGHFHGAAGA